ncbi:MAG: hypothetical protein J4F28_07280 [Nitrosopumilaceae archaeon]|nr:hypothetical protein [Nitrosopumilaceae archaeon]
MGRKNRRTPEQSAEKWAKNFAKAREEGRVGRPKKKKDTESKSGTE